LLLLRDWGVDFLKFRPQLVILEESIGRSSQI
jgi:hypothetical protein